MSLNYKTGLLRFLLLGTVLALIGCSSSTKSKGKKDGEIHIDVVKKTLPNGLTILISENHKLPIFSYYTYYKVGGKYEKPGITGASHLLEHMMFKGAKKYGAGEFDNIVEGNGGRNNAYTTNDNTVYYEDLPSLHLKKIIDLEADRMQNLLLEPVSFEKERNVVLEERKLRYENSDRGKIFLSMMKEMFKGTPYGTSVIGTIKDLKTVSRDQIFDYFKRYYAPNNAIIVITGDIDAKKTIKELEKKFGNIPATENLEKIKQAELDRLGFRFKTRFGSEIKLKGQTPNPNFTLAFPARKIGTRDGFVLDILASVLGGGESSYLSEKYVLTSDPKLSNIYAANYTLQESGVFFVGGELLSGKSPKNLKKDLIQSLEKGCDVAISERAVQKVKNQYFIEMLAGLDTNAGVAKFIGDREFYFGDHEFYKKELAIYQGVSVSELRSTCKKYLKREKNIFLSIWNQHK